MKIVNDEVVIASHGRGIWTVGLPELQNYEPIAATRFPKLEVDHSFATQIAGNINLLSPFDSSRIVLELMDGRTEILANMGANTSPITDQFIYNSTLEVEEVQVARLKLYAYEAGQEYLSIKEVLIFNVEEEPTNLYVNDFEEGSTTFAKLGFTEMFLPELNSTGLQTIHPYENNSNYYAVMQQPIIIESIDAPLTFDEIVLVEPGDSPDPNSESFYDFVRVSATKDFGRTWVTLAKYDASEQTAWLSNFANTTITPDLVFPKTIEVGQHFDIGDTVYFRFDLVTDPGVIGWGWYVDNIQYGLDVSTTDIVSPITELKLFPNPVHSTTTLAFELDQTADTEITLHDVQGRVVLTKKMGRLSEGSHQIPIALEDISVGNYFIKITSGDSSNSIQLTKL